MSQTKMTPLEQWICDTCGYLIESPKDGWIEWIRESATLKVSGFRICHHSTKSPIRAQHPGNPRGPSCYKYDDTPGRCGDHLHHWVGSTGMVHMLSFMDVGLIHDPEAKDVMRVGDIRNWTETFRRLFVPYYEEARQHFAAAEADDSYATANESLPYLPDQLQAVIEKYSQ